ncbi:MAG: carboxypeptidase regulatory-like domain-containing protein [Acidobacteriota bacterium]
MTVRRGGAPLPGVTVALAGPGLDALGPFTSLSDETDRDGVAMLPGLPAGTFTIRVTSGMETREAPVSLEAGRQTEIVIGF